MARTNTTEGQALGQLGGAQEDSRFHEGNRHLRVAYNKEEDPRFARGAFPRSSYTNDLKIQWLPCQVPGITGSAMGLVGLESIHFGRVRQQI